MITPTDVAVALQRTPPAEGSPEWDLWQLWINQALYLIGKRLDIDTLDPADVDYVVLQAVVAMARRPDDATVVDISVDDGRVSRTYKSATGRVTILPEWWALLDPTLGSPNGIGSFQLYGAPDPQPRQWVSSTEWMP